LFALVRQFENTFTGQYGGHQINSLWHSGFLSGNILPLLYPASRCASIL
jgi:hypothetical protein